jgi:hypothetical protein
LFFLEVKPWSPRRPLAAKCGAGNAHEAHEPPHLDCTCGVYAAKNLEHLRQLGYEGRGILGGGSVLLVATRTESGWVETEEDARCRGKRSVALVGEEAGSVVDQSGAGAA